MAILNTNGSFTGRVDITRIGNELMINCGYPEPGMPAATFNRQLDAALSALAKQLRAEICT